MPLLWSKLGRWISSRVENLESHYFVDVKHSMFFFSSHLYLLPKTLSGDEEHFQSSISTRQCALRVSIILISCIHHLLFFVWSFFMYECALIRNKIEKTPVIPVFLAEFDENDPSKFVKFSRNVQFPDLPHMRNSSSKVFFDELW